MGLFSSNTDLQQRFKSVIKRKSNAMKVFTKAKNELETADEEISDQITESEKFITEEKAAVSFLKNMQGSNKKQLEKMNNFLEPIEDNNGKK